MLVRIPDYYDEFRCLAGACPHSCCEKWKVVVDEESAERYRRELGPLGDRLRAAMTVDEEGDVCFPLNGGRCPFLDGENLCEIHKQLGEAATSVTCREHPRFTEDYGPFREVTLSASCPAANALLLGSEGPLTFRELETEEPEEEGDEWLDFLLSLRDALLARLGDRSLPLRRRLALFLLLAADAQELLNEERPEEIPALLETWEPWEMPERPDTPPLFPTALRRLGELEILEPDWPALLAQAENAERRVVPEPLLERIAVYFAFRYLLKAINDGDLLGRAQLVVCSVLVVERLAGVCGVEEALRRFSCEIEHSDGNLEALMELFWTEAALSPESLLRELSR